MSSDAFSQQKVWLPILEMANITGKPILIKCKEGAAPKGQDINSLYRLYQWNYWKDVIGETKEPYFTRSILHNEIVFDPDTPVWEDMKQEYDKLIETLDRLKIPYILTYTGGKGCHLHIFFKTNVPDKIFDQAKKAEYDIYEAIREYLFYYIVGQAKIDLKKLKIDLPKITFQVTSLGSQIRDFGTMREGGFCKTVILKVPDHKPDVPLPLVFPEIVPLWNVPAMHDDVIIQKIEDGIKGQVEYNKEIPTNLTGIESIEQIPCIANILKGLDAGRYYGANAIALICKALGYSWEKIEPFELTYLSRCKGLSQDDINLRVANSHGMFETSKRFSCTWIKKNLTCPCPGGCIVTHKRKEASNGNSSEPQYEELSLDDIKKRHAQENSRQLKVNLPDDHFISTYVKYQNSLSDAYEDFHIVNAMWILSAVVRGRVILKLKQEYIQPNIWVFIVAKSTTSRKSTAVNKARNLFEVATETTLFNDDYSIEGYLDTLSIHPILNNVRDEASGLLAKFHKKYNDGIFVLECAMYDCQNYKKTLTGGKDKKPREVEVKNPYVTKLYATTPDAFANNMEMGDITSGYGIRFLYVYPKYKKVTQPLSMETPEDAKAWAATLQKIKEMYNSFGRIDRSQPLEFGFNDDALEYYTKVCEEQNNYCDDENNEILNSVVGRAQVHIIKIAMLLEIGKSTPNLTITIESMTEAARMVNEYFIPSAMELIEQLQEDIKFNKIEKIKSVLQKLGGQAEHGTTLRYSKMVSREFAECITTMEESKQIQTFTVKGKKSNHYLLLNHNKSIPNFHNIHVVPTFTHTKEKCVKDVNLESIDTKASSFPDLSLVSELTSEGSESCESCESSDIKEKSEEERIKEKSEEERKKEDDITYTIFKVKDCYDDVHQMTKESWDWFVEDVMSCRNRPMPEAVEIVKSARIKLGVTA